jgi:hypothetical protein
MNKDHIIELIEERNLLRKQNGLPLLDVEREIDRLQRVDFVAAFERWKNENQELIRQTSAEVLASMRGSNSDWKPQGFNAHMAYYQKIEKALRKKFEESV